MKNARIFLILMLSILLWKCGEEETGYADIKEISISDDQSVSIEILSEVSNQDVKKTPSCKGSLIQESYKKYDDECSDITEKCVIMPTPKPFQGCFCLVCGFLGAEKRCFYVCCSEKCNPYEEN